MEPRQSNRFGLAAQRIYGTLRYPTSEFVTFTRNLGIFFLLLDAPKTITNVFGLDPGVAEALSNVMSNLSLGLFATAFLAYVERGRNTDLVGTLNNSLAKKNNKYAVTVTPEVGFRSGPKIIVDQVQEIKDKEILGSHITKLTQDIKEGDSPVPVKYYDMKGNDITETISLS